MKKSYLFLILLSIFSCSSKKELIGTWYGIEKHSSILSFEFDSLTIYTPNPQKILWKATKNEIKFELLPNSSPEYKKIILKYKISKDTLTTFYNGIKVMYLKANSYTDFLNKKYNLKFELPKNENLKEYQGSNENFAIKIFIGKQNGTTISRTENYENLNKINEYAKEFINLFGTSQEIFTHYQVFADKNISEIEMKKVYDKLRKTRIKKIYRMYEKIDKYSEYRCEYIKE